jgi:hypothetical protein
MAMASTAQNAVQIVAEMMVVVFMWRWRRHHRFVIGPGDSP